MSTPPPTTSPAPHDASGSAGSPARRPRKWLRRGLIAVVVGAALLALLVVMLPTIATSGFAVRKVESIIGDMIDRDVRIDGLRAGWRTPVAIGRLEIAPAPGEGAYPPLIVEGVSVPLTLWQAARGGWRDPEQIRIERVEGNFVRRPDDSWNWLEIIDQLASDDPDEPEDEDKPPAPLPINQAALRINTIDLRVVDPSVDLIAGWEGGFLEVLWQGGNTPLTIDLGGDLRVNDARQDWKARAKLEHFLDVEGIINPMGARLTASTGGMVAPHQLGTGGFFVSASARGDSESTLRILVPIRETLALARGWSILDESLPAAEGVLDLNAVVAANDDAGLARWNLTLDAKDIAADTSEWIEPTLPPQSLRIASTGALDLESMVVDHATLLVAGAALSMDARVGRWDFAEPGVVRDATAALRVDLAEATALADLFLSGEGRAFLDGDFLLDAAQTGERTGEVRMVFEPGTLAHLPATIEWPDLVKPLPLDLTPLATELVVRLEFEDILSAWLDTFRFPGGLELSLAGGWEFESARGQGLLKLEGGIAELLDLAAVYLADTTMLPSGDGRFAFAVSPFYGDGDDWRADLGLNMEGLSLSGDMIPVLIVDEDIQLTAAGRWSPETSHGSVDLFALRTSPLDLNARGGLRAEGVQGDVELTLRLAALSDWIAEYLPPDLAINDGALRFAASVEAENNGPFAANVEVTTPSHINVAMRDLFAFAGPITMEASASGHYSEEGLKRLDFDLGRMRLADAVDLRTSFSYDIESGDTASGDAILRLGYGDLLALIDPTFWEKMGIAAEATGGTELELAFAFPMTLNESGMPQPNGVIEGEGFIATSLVNLGVQAGDMIMMLADAFDERQFQFAFDPADIEAMEYLDEAATGFAELESTLGAYVANLEMMSSANWSGIDGLRFDMSPLEIGLVEYATPLEVFSLNNLAMELSFAADAAFRHLEVPVVMIEAPGVVTLEAGGSFDTEAMAYQARLELLIAQLGDLFDYLPGDIDAPNLTGRLLIGGELAGVLPPSVEEHEEPAPFDFPVGTVYMRLEDGDLLLDNDMRLEGLTVFFDTEIIGPGEPLTVNLDVNMVEFFNNAFRYKPPRNLRLLARGQMIDLDELDLSLDELFVTNYQATGFGSLSLRGLQDALADDREGLARWFDHLTLDSEIRLQQDLDGWTGFLDLLGMSGLGDVTLRLSSAPRSSVQLNTLFDLQDAGIVFGDLFEIEGLEGTWEASKGLRLSPAARLLPPPPAGQFTFRRMSLGPPNLALTMRRSRVTMRGFDGGIGMDLESRDLMGGSATGRFDAGLRGGDPYLASRVVFTGFDAGLLGGGRPMRRNDPSWEINGISNFNWRLRDVPGERMLEDFAFDVRSTRIGSDALGRLLRTLDRDAEDPRFQNALAALNFGTPRSFSTALEGGLLSMRAELGIRGGVRVPIPIMDRQPIGEAWEVYRVNEFAELLELKRFGLLMLLAPDLETVERLLEERTQVP